MKVTAFLRKDHEALKSLFDRFGKSSRAGKERENLFAEIQREILIHSQTETEIFYPALKNSPSARAAQLVDESVADHETVDNLLGEVSRLNSQDKQFEVKAGELFDQVIQHMEREESDVFDEARKIFSEVRLEELGLEMEERRRMLTQLAA